MLEVAVSGLEEAAARLKARAERVGDLRPALQAAAAVFEQEHQQAFARLQSPEGEPWNPLADSTIEARARHGAVAQQRTAEGKLTGRAHRRRELVRGDARPLVDTGRLRSSQHWNVTADAITFSMLAYGKPHVTGSLVRSGRPPKRNFTVFELQGDRWTLAPRQAELFNSLILRFVRDGVPQA